MAEPRSEPRMDERLAALLEVERALEARVQGREEAARLKVARAEAALAAVQSATPPGLDVALAQEAARDEASQAAALAAIAAQGHEALQRLAQVTEEDVDALARRVLERILGDAPPVCPSPVEDRPGPGAGAVLDKLGQNGTLGQNGGARERRGGAP